MREQQQLQRKADLTTIPLIMDLEQIGTATVPRIVLNHMLSIAAGDGKLVLQPQFQCDPDRTDAWRVTSLMITATGAESHT